jgi:hypothetical protein
MAKIYVASSWRNELQPTVVSLLRQHGHEVYDFRNPAPGEKGFAWAELDPEWRKWTEQQFIQFLKHPVSDKGFNLDFDGMKWADVCVMLLPCGRSAHTEAGWMKGVGKKVYAVMAPEQEPELMYKLFDRIFSDIIELVLYLDYNKVKEVRNG